MSEPVLCALVFAERDAIEISGRHSLSGVFSHLQSAQFPFMADGWWIYLSMTNLHQPFSVNWRMVHESGLQLFDIKTDASQSDRTKVWELNMNVKVPFPLEGNYSLLVSIDGLPFASRVLPVVKVG